MHKRKVKRIGCELDPKLYIQITKFRKRKRKSLTTIINNLLSRVIAGTITIK